MKILKNYKKEFFLASWVWSARLSGFQNEDSSWIRSSSRLRVRFHSFLESW